MQNNRAPVSDAASICQVKIRFFGPIISIVKRSEDTMSMPKARMRVSDLIDALCLRYGDEFREIAIHKGDLNSGLLVSVNGECVLDASEELKEDDQIQLLIASQMKGG